MLFLNITFEKSNISFIWLCGLAAAPIYLSDLSGLSYKMSTLNIREEIQHHLCYFIIMILAFCSQGVDNLELSYIKIGLMLLLLGILVFLVRHQYGKVQRTLEIMDIMGLFLVSVISYYLAAVAFNGIEESIVLRYVPISILIVFIFTLFILFMTADWNLTVSISMLLNMIWILIHCFVYQFRGSVLVPGDFKSITTAATVVGKYQFFLTKEMWWLCFFSICIITLVGNFKKIRVIKNRAIFRILGTSVTILAILLCYHSDFIGIMQLPYENGWQQKAMYNTVGCTLGFVEIMKKSKVNVPENYSEKLVRQIAEIYYPDAETENTIQPNIIVIMNEAFADIGDIGKIDTNKDYMPFTHTQAENGKTSIGRVLVSTIGGDTCKTEYEFLTGNSQELNPTAIAFTTEIYKDIYSIATTLKSQGYQTIATHPNSGSNWKRNSVYKHMGFEETYFIDFYDGADEIRNFVTDEAIYEKIMDWLKDSTQPQFIFAVTMQNHGSYDGSALREGETLPIIRNNVTEPGKVDQYLSLIYESDRAIEKLINEVDQLEDPTVVVMFGDHFPNEVIWGQISEGQETEDLSEKQIIYATPYIMHANYDIDVNAVPKYMSINYLGSNILNLCKLQMTAYDKYLLEMQKIIPAFNFQGMMTEDNTWFFYEEEIPEEYKEKIGEYNILEYNARYGKTVPQMFSVE